MKKRVSVLIFSLSSILFVLDRIIRPRAMGTIRWSRPPLPSPTYNSLFDFYKRRTKEKGCSGGSSKLVGRRLSLH